MEYGKRFLRSPFASIRVIRGSAFIRAHHGYNFLLFPWRPWRPWRFIILGSVNEAIEQSKGEHHVERR